MQVSIENTGGIGRRMTVSVPANDVEEKVKSRLAKLAKTVKIPGFRPGKVPGNIVESRFGGQVMQEIAGEMVESSYREALVENSLMPAGGLSIEPKSMTRGQDLEYVATFEIFPDIEKVDIDGEEIERPQVEIEEEDINHTLETMRQRQVTWEPKDSEANMDDRVMIDFDGSIDGEPFEGGKAEDFPVVLGSGSMLKDFEDGLTGATSGQEIEISVSFPDNYPGAEVAGKTAIFAVKVKQVAVAKLPDLDEAFAHSLGIEEGGVDRLREEVKENLGRELDERLRHHMRMKVMERILSLNEFPVPKQLIEEEINRMQESMANEMKSKGMPDSDKLPDIDRSKYEPEAQRRVSLGLILQEVVAKNELKPDEDRVRQRVEQIAQSYEQPEQFAKWYYSENQRLAQLKAQILEEQVIEKLLSGANLVDKPTSFQKFMHPELDDEAHDHRDHDHENCDHQHHSHG